MTDSIPLYRLMSTIEDRKRHPPQRSYTHWLLEGGVERMGDKIQEEVREVIQAAQEPGEEGHRHVVAEAADVLYHLLVLLAHCGVSLQEVEAELARREGVSGIEEKENRKG